MIRFVLLNYLLIMSYFFFQSIINSLSSVELKFKSNLEKLISFSIVCFYFYFLFFLLRLVRIFFLKINKVDFKKFFEMFEFSFDLICFLIFFFFLLFFLKKVIFIYFRIHCFRIFYTYYNVLNKIYLFFFKLDVIILNLIPTQLLKEYRNGVMKTAIYIYIFYVIITGIKNYFIFDLTFMPILGLYYSIYHIYSYTRIMKYNFDFGLYLLSVNSKAITPQGFFVLELYRKYVILGYSDFSFFDDIETKNKPINYNTLTFRYRIHYF